MTLSSTLIAHPAFAEWLCLRPGLYLHCAFPPYHSSPDGYGAESGDKSEKRHWETKRQQYQHALHDIFAMVGAFPENNVAIRTPTTTFSILTRSVEVYDEGLLLRFTCSNPG